MIIFNDEEYGRRVAKAAGVVFNPEGHSSICRVVDDRLLGGVIYEGYTGVSVSMHIAGFDPYWINRDMIWVCFDYPFNQLGVTRLFGQVPDYNQHALEFDLKLGFKIISRIENVYPNGDMIVISMDRDECRWLNLRPRGFLLKEMVSGG